MKFRYLVAVVCIVVAALVPLSCKKNRAPSVPSLSGPGSGRYGDTLSFSVSATDPDKDDVFFSIEWGDGATADWIGPYASGAATTVKHVFADSGSYQMRAKAKDTKDVESEWSGFRTVSIGFAIPSKPLTPDGPTTGDEGVFYTFSTSTTASSGESLLYQFDFGDTLGSWVGPFASGSTASDSHAFGVADSYAVKVKAKTRLGVESGWSDAHTIVISIGAPAVPGAPAGPASLYAHVSADFKVVTTAGGRDVKYVLDWADGKVETTATSHASGDTATLSHAWAGVGTFAVKARAFLAQYPTRVSGWSAPLSVTVLANGAPAAPQIQVPASAVPGVLAFFTAQTTDPDNDSVSLRFDFGDGLGEWSGLVPSGTVLSDSHAYLRAETVYVKCKARDKRGAESAWCDSVQLVVEPAGLVSWFWWKNNTAREPGISSPVLVDAGGEDILYFGCHDGLFYGVDLGGATRYVGTSVFFGDTFTGHPAYSVVTNHIIVGNTDGELYAFDPNLSRVWHWPGKTPDSLTHIAWGTPALNGDKVYVGHDDDSLFLFQDFGSQCGRIAAFYLGARVVDAPVIDADGNVIFGTDSGYLYKMDGGLNSPTWRAPLAVGSKIHSPAIGPDGTIYCGTSDGHVFALNPADGSMKWPAPASADGEAWRIVIGSSQVFVGTSSGKVYSLAQANGAENWVKSLFNGVYASPVLTVGGYVYFQNSDDVLYCLSPSNGATVWMCDCPSFLPNRNPVEYHYTPSPTIDASGNLVVVGRDAVYYVSGLRGETLANTAWPKWQHDVFNGGRP